MSARRYFFIVGWTKGMAIPAYIDGPFLSYGDARDSAVDWMASGRADAYSVMASEPQEAWPGIATPQSSESKETR